METKPKKKAAPKKRKEKYDTKLAINGTLDDVLKASFKNTSKKEK
jgi:hypothetical protein